MSALVISEAQWSAMPPREREQWEAMDESTRFYARKPEPPALDEPTDEQLENVACALGLYTLASPLIKRPPYWRESMLNLHALVQETAMGDEEAAQRLGFYLDAFAGVPVSVTADQEDERG